MGAVVGFEVIRPGPEAEELVACLDDVAPAAGDRQFEVSYLDADLEFEAARARLRETFQRCNANWREFVRLHAQ